jgi:dsRNA-specific ribonuclease
VPNAGDKRSTTKRDDTMVNVFTGTERWKTEIWEDGDHVTAYGSTPAEAEKLASEKAYAKWEDDEEDE